jgi:hypothetical protein
MALTSILLIAALPAASQESGLSPDYKAAAEVLYEQFYSLERMSDCTSISQEYENPRIEERYNTLKNAASLVKTEADKAMHSLLEGYMTIVESGHLVLLLYGTCTFSPEVEEAIKSCREAVETGLNGGSISPVTVCEY